MTSFNEWLKERVVDHWEQAQKELEKIAETIHLGLGVPMRKVDSKAFKSSGRLYPTLKFQVEKPVDEVGDFIDSHRDFKSTREKMKWEHAANRDIVVTAYKDSASTTDIVLINKSNVE